ncbi:glycosyltransferase [Caldichromatium japonicum]|uniref:Beta-monoglucosyldiacylglycerol synthase n=1 Tax=Caldichromatium japonicum TaxID=2699430 RepID=A0A6G7VAF8_9GAMM|nr:glycosyltransferase family 2 protein [Caldichromatium japonicum]QIK36855.1 glycosyltransferase [Caldichromatium japonicum]
MNRLADLIIPLLIAALTVSAWWILNRPKEEPPWPTRIQGFAFSPMRSGQNPTLRRYPTLEEIDADLALLEGRAHAVRSYSVDGPLAEIPRLAAQHRLNVTLGAWIGPERKANDSELARLLQVLARGYRNVVRVMVGNEAILRRDVRVDELINYLERIRRLTQIPVSTAEPWHVWLKHPELVEHVDFITLHLLPYWEGIPFEQAVDYAINRYNQVKTAYPDKPIIIGEVGWPSNGRRNRGAEPSLANQTRFLRRFLAIAESEGYVYYLMEAFDQPWKVKTEGAAGTYWGVYDVNRRPKFVFTEPVVRIPQWRELAGLSVVIGVLLLTLLYRDSETLSKSGKGFLALITYAISTAAVLIVYDYTRQYMTPATTLVGVLLLFGGVGVLVLLMAEAHEWAEALWLRRWRRPFPLRLVPDEALPFVSIHLPAYNEPPEMLKETLDGLASLDYPAFEVLVIDNNTQDPAVWEPVRDYCARLGPRFRFFHVVPLSGYKAGALNFALRHTDPDAKVVAVIDADYIVRPQWLRHLAPAFADPKIAIVQAPQDYRDGGQSAFKAMCLAEYRGFFHIGMITRNERNAIIQHGTMTMIRRQVLESLGGWAEWCITEDAELGLRVFAAGYQALYIPCTYGQGLMPDTFADFCKQRYRWAYGAVRILIQHRHAILGLRKSRLTLGQRYHFIVGWLSWFADSFNLLFNLLALGWSVAMALAPKTVSPPYLSVALVPLVLFGFKLIKTLVLYRRRVTASLRQSIAAGLAGLALSHTIARAILAGLFTQRLGFFRTPKLAQASALIRALMDVREEALLVCAFMLAAYAVMQREDAFMLDVQVWTLVLLAQSIPYLASVLVSLISAWTHLPAVLVGPMSEMACGEATTAKQPVLRQGL